MATRKNKKRNGLRLAVVVSRFNDFITKRLLAGCLDELDRRGIPSRAISVSWVPGSFEVPVAALRYARRKEIDAVICLGAVIRGETYHFELVAQNAARGVLEASLITGKPVIFGVLATDTVNQAYARAKEKGENKGRDAAQAACEMVELLKSL